MVKRSGQATRAPARAGRVTIGKGSFVDPTVSIGHPGKGSREELSSGHWSYLAPVTIGRNCTVRANAVLYAGVTLGDGTQTGNGAVIREDTRVGNHCLIG